MKFLLGALTILLLCARAGGAESYKEEVLTLAQAKRLVSGCESYARDNKLAPLSMAVYDAAGNIKLFLRQDGAKLLSADFAHIKGRTAAVSGLATSELAAIEYENKDKPLGIGYIDGVTIVQGGVAVASASGQHLGGFGVSGAPAVDDEACGVAGIEEMLGK
jgi:uncharacterized protein GlcG (DUF336 family)